MAQTVEETEAELHMSQMKQQEEDGKGHGSQALLCLTGKEKDVSLRAGESLGRFKYGSDKAFFHFWLFGGSKGSKSESKMLLWM